MFVPADGVAEEADGYLTVTPPEAGATPIP
jgi:hypothetical protein